MSAASIVRLVGQHDIDVVIMELIAVTGRAPVGTEWEAVFAKLPWLRLHLLARHLLTIPVRSPDWPEIEAELVPCAELRRILIAAGWFN